jgi:hypothetical protein
MVLYVIDGFSKRREHYLRHFKFGLGRPALFERPFELVDPGRVRHRRLCRGQ